MLTLHFITLTPHPLEDQKYIYKKKQTDTLSNTKKPHTYQKKKIKPNIPKHY